MKIKKRCLCSGRVYKAFLIDVYLSERYLEMEQSLESLTEDDQHEMSFVFFDPQEETLLKTVTLTALDNIIKEIKAILEVTSNTLVSIYIVKLNSYMQLYVI